MCDAGKHSSSASGGTENSVQPASLLPHRGQMLLITEIVSFDSRMAITRAVVAEKWPMTDSHGADAMVLIELVAQTAGINNGWTLVQEKGPEVDHRGWIVGIKHARLFSKKIPLGTVIETTSENTFAYEGLREVSGTVRIGSQVAAQVTLQLMQALG